MTEISKFTNSKYMKIIYNLALLKSLTVDPLNTINDCEGKTHRWPKDSHVGLCNIILLLSQNHKGLLDTCRNTLIKTH